MDVVNHHSKIPDKTCCLDLSDFNHAPLPIAFPPPKKGVYIIRVMKKGDAVDAIFKNVNALLVNFPWPYVREYIEDRMNRLKNIGDCPVIYIGGAGVKAGSKNTLQDRVQELANRHTISIPLWILVYFHWTLEYYWKVVDNPSDEENDLKKRYTAAHPRKRPALVVN